MNEQSEREVWWWSVENGERHPCTHNHAIKMSNEEVQVPKEAKTFPIELWA
jgi:hypothetical protein